MELEYLSVILKAKKEDFDKQSNLKKFYKETLTEEEYKNFEKLLKTKKSEITELEGIVKKMSQYSDQYAYERIMAMSETEFNSIKDEEIELRKEGIRKHNAEISDKKESIAKEIEDLKEEIVALKNELEEMTNGIAETGKYTKESVKRAKEIKETIKANNEKIEKNKELINDNDKDIITNDDISLDFETYKEQKLSELSKKNYVENIPEVSVMDEFLCKVQKKGKTPEEIEECINEFKKEYIGGFEKEGYEYFDKNYRSDFDVKEELDKDAKAVTDLLEKYFEVIEKGGDSSLDKGQIERKMLVKYNTNKRHNVSEITKAKLLKELIEGKPFYGKIKDNNVLDNGCFINLNDRIAVTKERIDKIKEWKDKNSTVRDYINVLDLIDQYADITKTRKVEEENKDKIEEIYKNLKKYFDKEIFDRNEYAVGFITLYEQLKKACKDLKSFNAELDKYKTKKIVINKKEHNKNIEVIKVKIEAAKEIIKGVRKKIGENLKEVSKYLDELLKEPEMIMYPEDSSTDIEKIYNILHVKDSNDEFTVASEVDYLESLEKDLKYAELYLDKYESKKETNKKASIAYLCANLGVTSISDGIFNVLLEEKAKKEIKASDISKRINEARINLYLREQKEKAESESSKAKSEILGAVLDHLDLEETKTDIFASI